MFHQITENSKIFLLFGIFFIKIISISIAHSALCSLNDTAETNSSHFEGKIIGGKAVSLSRFPFQAQLFNLGALCSGTILNSWTILTSAHCLDHNKNTREMRIQTGSRYVYDFKARIYRVESYVIHTKYNISAQFANDIALLFLTRALRFGKHCQKAMLASSDKWMNVNEKTFIVTGWGWTKYGGPISELGLMMTQLSFVTSKSCGRLHQLTITPDMFCLYGEGSRDTCKGDSGGGVLWNGMIIGITSHGDGCAKKHKPSVYANVYYFRYWIKRQVEKFFVKYCQKKENQNARNIKKTKRL